MMDSDKATASWLRRHSNGWVGSVTAYANGEFVGGGQAPTMPGVTVGSHGIFRTLARAMQEADDDVKRAGHACTADCEPWHELILHGEERELE